MNTKKRIRIILAFAFMAMLTVSANAETLFSEDFQTPASTDSAAIETYQKTAPSGWIRASEGYNASQNGINLVGTNQVYSTRYTNSGATTAEGVIGTLTAETYTLSFDVSADDRQPDSVLELPYKVELVVFNALGDPRNDVRPSYDGNLVKLVQATGNAPEDGSTASVSVEVTIDPASLNIGKDMAVRIIGATTSANIDNIVVATAAPPAEAPTVDAGPDMASWSGAGAQLDATVINNDPNDPQAPLTYSWTSTPTAHAVVEFTPASADIEDPVVTITKVSELVGENAANGGFEDPALADGASTSTNGVPNWITQWSLEGSGIWNTDNSPNAGARNLIAGDDFDGIAPEGENVGYVNTDAGYSHALYQETSVVLESGKTYELSALVANPYSINGGFGPDYRLEILANGSILASAGGASPADANSLVADSVVYVASASDPNEGNPLSIRLVSEAGAVAQTLYFDDVQILVDGLAGTVVPAPEVVSVILTLAANNVGSSVEDGVDSVTIDVYDDACAAAVALGAGSSGPTDFDNDCDTDMDDLMVIINAWMNDYALSAPEPKL